MEKKQSSENQIEPIPKEMNTVAIVSHGKVGFARVPVQLPTEEHQVLVKVDSATLNPSDILFMKGKYNVKLKYPYTPGWEGAGIVVKTGSSEQAKSLLGKRVAFMKAQEIQTYNYGGSMAEYCCTNAFQCIPISEETSLEEAASFIVNPLTAVAMVERIKQLKTKAVIITAASSQIGRMLVQLCLLDKITPICLVRRKEQVEILQKLGAKYVVDTSLPDYSKTLGEICMKEKPSTCFECISGTTTGEMLNYLTYKSTLILYGTLSEQPAGGINTIGFIGKAQTIESFLLFAFDTKELSKRAEKLYKTVLKTQVQKRFGFHEIEEALKFYQSNQTNGKILLQAKLTPQPKL